MKFSIIIPAYNEEEAIGSVLQELQQHVPEAEILVVDDCSTDRTCETAATFPNVTVLRQPVNKGPVLAIAAGIEAAAHDVILTMDADGQHPADRIVSIAEPVLHGETELVLGVREKLPRLGEKVIAMTAGVQDATTGLKAMRKELGTVMKKDFVYGGILVVEAKRRDMRIREIPINVKERMAGTSVHSDLDILIKSLKFALWRAGTSLFK